VQVTCQIQPATAGTHRMLHFALLVVGGMSASAGGMVASARNALVQAFQTETGFIRKVCCTEIGAQWRPTSLAQRIPRSASAASGFYQLALPSLKITCRGIFGKLVCKYSVVNGASAGWLVC
jgi:hypothetical protein